MAGLSAALGVNPRTVLRDIKLLRTRFGAPLEYDRQAGGYRYTEPFLLWGPVGRRRRLAVAVAAELCRRHGLAAVTRELEQLAPDMAAPARRYLKRSGVTRRV